MKKTLVLLSLLLVLILLLVSCGGGGTDAGTTGTEPAPSGTTVQQTDDPSLPTITGVTFPGKTVVYDGTEQVLAVEGDLPAGASVVYTNEKATEAGTYTATAAITCAGYNPLTLSATLTINTCPITGVTLEGDTVEYDGLTHQIAVTGNVPAGVTVAYTGGQDGKRRKF